MLSMRRILAMLLALCLVGYGHVAVAGVHTHDLTSHEDIEHAAMFGGHKVHGEPSSLAGHHHTGHHHHDDGVDTSHSNTSGEEEHSLSHQYGNDAPEGNEAPHEHVVHAHGCASTTLVDPIAEFSAVLPTRGPRTFGEDTSLTSLVAAPPLRPPIENL